MRALRARRPGPVGIAAAVLVAAVLGVGMLWLRDAPLLAVDEVTITGVQGDQSEEIRSALRSAGREMTTLHVRQDALRAAVRRYPTVASLTARADLPDRLRIEVRSRVPVAALDTGRRRIAVAADGTVLDGSRTEGLPRVTVAARPAASRVSGGRPTALVALLAAAPAPLRARVERAFAGPQGLTAQLREGPRLRFGTGDRIAAKWVAAQTVLADEQSRGASYVDLRLPERPAAGGLPPVTDEQGQVVAPDGSVTAPDLAAPAGTNP